MYVMFLGAEDIYNEGAPQLFIIYTQCFAIRRQNINFATETKMLWHSKKESSP